VGTASRSIGEDPPAKPVPEDTAVPEETAVSKDSALPLAPSPEQDSATAQNTPQDARQAPTPADAKHQGRASEEPTLLGQFFRWFTQGNRAENSTGNQEKALAELTSSWDFQRSGDQNLDLWPDDWKRIVGREFPKYLPVQIVARNGNLEQSSVEAGKSLGKIYVGWKRGRLPSKVVLESLPPEVDSLFDQTIDRCLEMQVNGGSINLCSPTIPIEPRFYYRMQLDIQCQGMNHHKAWAQLELLDEKENVISIHPTQELTGDHPWKKIDVNALQDRPVPQARKGRLRIMVEGPKSSFAQGIVRVDRIRIWKVPRIRVTLDRAANIFADGESVRVRVIATGLSADDRLVKFQLLDRYGNQMDESSTRFERPKEKELLVSTDLADLGLQEFNGLEVDGQAIWNPEIREPGFYRIRVELGRAANQTLYRMISFAILNTDVSLGKGRFGWSLTSESMPTDFNHLPTLAQQAALGWIKVPIWYDPHNIEKSDEYAWLIDRFQNLGMRCVGVLDLPPKNARESFASTGTANAAQLFQDQEIWQPHVDPVLTRMSLGLVLFQLGSDKDLSFQGYNNLAQRLNEIRKHFREYGQDIQIGLPWNWLDVGPVDVSTPSDFITLRTFPPLTGDEIETYAKLLSSDTQMKWISLEPLDSRRYTDQHRIQNLVERMLACTKSGVEAAFVPDPIHQHTGMMLPDGSPTPLFLPWRTLSFHLTGAKFIGSFALRGGSTNHIFERDGQAILVGWNNAKTREQLYLGDDVKMCDLWGNVSIVETIVDNSFREQVIEFSEEPVIVTGLSLPIARWRISFQLANYENQVPGAARFKLKGVFSNGFDQAVVGNLELFAPELIHNDSVKKTFDLPARQDVELPIDLNLRPDASTGKQMITAIFDIQAGTQYRFRVFNPMYIGAQDIEVELSYEVDPDGNLVIRQDLVNNTNRTLDFECTLFAPDRVHLRQQLLQVPPGRVTRYYRLEQGAELKGKTVWLRCQQLDNGRYLNYRTNIDW
jgi:hypothetical protein